MKNDTDEYFVSNKKEYSFREKCSSCLQGPKQIIRSIVLLTCTIVVIYQIIECMKKIQNPPITTYTHFDFNESITYPAVTVCRDPPYKPDVLEKYGLYGHPRYTSEWKYFPFGTVDLKDFWEEATYSIADNFIAYGLNHSSANVRIEKSFNFILGQCQTIYPKHDMFTALKETGFSFLLNHSTLDMDTTSSTIPPGYHIYIHQSDEVFTEYATELLAEYLYANVGEELEVKLTVQELNMLPYGKKDCESDLEYSASECSDTCRTKDLVDIVGCSGPWMDSDAPYCSNYTDMKDLIVNYISSTNKFSKSGCICRCKSKIYQGFVVDRNSYSAWNTMIGRTEMAQHQTQLYIYFNNKMVSIYEETHNYDWSSFLSDFGASLGFLLGLSVLGVITLLEEICELIVKPMIKKRSTSEDGTVPASPEWTRSKDNQIISANRHSIETDKIPDSQNGSLKSYRKFDTPYGEKRFYLQ